jgi:hypothetical protein
MLGNLALYKCQVVDCLAIGTFVCHAIRQSIGHHSNHVNLLKEWIPSAQHVFDIYSVHYYSGNMLQMKVVLMVSVLL